MRVARPIVDPTAETAPDVEPCGMEAAPLVEFPRPLPTAMDRPKDMDIDRLKATVARDGYAVDAQAVAEAILRRVALRRSNGTGVHAAGPPRLRAVS